MPETAAMERLGRLGSRTSALVAQQFPLSTLAQVAWVVLAVLGLPAAAVPAASLSAFYGRGQRSPWSAPTR
jgi:hypothetical protein